MFWKEDKMNIVLVDDSPFSADVKMVDVTLYSPHLVPIQIPKDYEEGRWQSCNLTKDRFMVNWKAELRPPIELLDGHTK